jgi:hypothetical protein
MKNTPKSHHVAPEPKKKIFPIVDLWGYRQEYPCTLEHCITSGNINGYHEVCIQEAMLFPRNPDINLHYFEHERLAKFKAIFWSTDGEYYFLKKIITAPNWQLPGNGKTKKH